MLMCSIVLAAYYAVVPRQSINRVVLRASGQFYSRTELSNEGGLRWRWMTLVPRLNNCAAARKVLHIEVVSMNISRLKYYSAD